MLSVPEGTLRYWRKVGIGPKWLKLEGSIRYDLADVLAYIDRGRRTPSVRANMEEMRVIVRDTGMRNISEVCGIRIEHIDWHNRVIFNPKGKTPEARRSVPMSDRVLDLLMTRCAGKTAGWVFPSDRSKTGHLTWINQQFARARAKAGLPKDLVMYCGRHDFGTYALSHTGNLAAVMKTMGHRDVKTAMQYQHPELESIRVVINDRNSRHNLRHKTEFLQ